MLLLKKLKRWHETWKLAKLAQGILADTTASDMASVNAKAIIAALAERRPICRHCFQVYTPKELSFAERFQIRAILMIPDSELDPMLCETCYANTTSVFNRQATNIGTSNSGHANMVLKKAGG